MASRDWQPIIMFGRLKKISRWGRTLVLVGFLLFLGEIFWQERRNFAGLSFASPWLLLPLFLTEAGILVTNGFVLRQLMLPFNISLTVKEWLGLAAVTSAGNYLAPLVGGPTFRAIYLKKKHHLAYTDFLSSLAGIYILVFFTNSLVGLVTLGLVYIIDGQSSLLISFVLGLIFLSLLLIILFSPQVGESPLPIIKNICRVINGWHRIRKERRIMAAVVFAALMNIFLAAAAGTLEYAILGSSISPEKVVLITIVSMLALLINLTPGALGIRESLAIFSASVVNIPPYLVLATSLLDRLVSLVASLACGSYAYAILKKGEK